MNKVVVLGLDGADWRVIQPYLDDGTMPNLSHLVETGLSGPLRSTNPPQSPVAWASFLTGQTPYRHGVFDFRERSQFNPTRLIGVTSRSIRSETFLQVLSRYNRRVGAINIPFTFPPFAVNGFLLSGWGGGRVKGATLTYPEGFEFELEEQVNGFPLDNMEWMPKLGQLEVYADQVTDVTRHQAKTLEYVMLNKPWDVLVQVFEGPDKLQHPLMHILDSTHPQHDPMLAHKIGHKLRAFFVAIDELLGTVCRNLPKDAILIIMSDHGFRSIHKLFDLKDILSQLGFLKTQRHMTAEQSLRGRLRKYKHLVPNWLLWWHRNPQRIGALGLMGDLDWSMTRAYTTSRTSHDVCINLVGREPNGIVEPGAEYDVLVSDIQTKLFALRDPATGFPVVNQVFPASEHNYSPTHDIGPDLIVEPGDGLGACDGEKGANLAPLRKWKGYHALHGIFVANGPEIRQGETISQSSILDIAPTILYLADVPIPTNIDGQVLDLFSDDRLVEQPSTYVQGKIVQHEVDHILTSEEEKQIEERLRGLGYL